MAAAAVVGGRFPFNKNLGLKFRKFHVPDGTVHSGCTDPTQATACLVIVLASRIQKRGTGDNNLVKWKGTFRSNRPKWPDWSERTTFKADSEYSGRTKPKWSAPFDVATEITGILGWMESTQNVGYGNRSLWRWHKAPLRCGVWPSKVSWLGSSKNWPDFQDESGWGNSGAAYCCCWSNSAFSSCTMVYPETAVWILTPMTKSTSYRTTLT